MPNVKAEVRIRPSRAGVLEYNDTSVVVSGKTFTFSRVHSTTTQRALYESSVAPLIDEFIDGHDCAVVAYGQTGSGKTYTMGIGHGSNGALVHHSLSRLFGLGVVLCISFIEIYNDEIIDLLGQSRSPLNVRQSGDGLAIVGLTEHTPASYDDALALLARGCRERTTKSTKMNSSSSRSHAVFTITLRQEKEGGIVESQMAFVDLAGSERLKRTECSGRGVRESISINSGLLALGNVINALYTKRSHVPYRDSKITRILARCLGSRLLLLACISQEQDDLFETANTLKYASCAALISTEEKVHVVGDKDKLVIERMKREISRLKDENMRLRGLLGKKQDQGEESIKSHPYVAGLLEIIRKNGIGAEDGGMLCDIWKGEAKDGHCGARRISKRPVGEEERTASFRVKTQEEVKSNNTLYNAEIGIKHKNNITANIERECMSNKDGIKVVTFDLTRSPVLLENNTPANKRVLFTPKKERPMVQLALCNTFDYSPLAMAMAGAELVVACADGGVRQIGERVSTVFRDSSIRCVEYSTPRSSIFYSMRSLLKLRSPDGTAMPVHGYRSEISSLKIEGDYIYTGHEDGTFYALDLRNMAVLFSLQAHQGSVLGIEQVGTRVYTCSRDHTVRFVESAVTGARPTTPSPGLSPPHYDTVTGLLSFQDSLISFSRDCSLKTWKDGVPFKTVPGAHDSWIKAGAALDTCWATGCKSGVVRCWAFLDNSVRSIGCVDVKAPVNVMAGRGNSLWVGSLREIKLYEIKGNK